MSGRFYQFHQFKIRRRSFFGLPLSQSYFLFPAPYFPALFGLLVRLSTALLDCFFQRNLLWILRS